MGGECTNLFWGATAITAHFFLTGGCNHCTLRAMTLDQYLLVNAVTNAEFAERIGCDRTTVSRLRRGITRPEWELVEAIVKATAGAVSPNDFLFAEHRSQAIEAAQ
jgi:transcriptional regulator with XRE-family HTH domain